MKGQPSYLVEAAQLRQQRLTNMRARILELHGEGLRNPQIAKRLGVSQATVGKLLVQLGVKAHGRPGERLF